MTQIKIELGQLVASNYLREISSLAEDKNDSRDWFKLQAKSS